MLTLSQELWGQIHDTEKTVMVALDAPDFYLVASAAYAKDCFRIATGRPVVVSEKLAIPTTAHRKACWVIS